MIALSIARSSLGLTPLSIADDGTGTYVLMSFTPGQRQRDNAIAASRWIDGGQLVSSKTDILTLDMVVKIQAATVPLLQQYADDLDAALNQFSYTITQTITGQLTSTTYTCMPASTSFPFDAVSFRAGLGYFTASIPRQP